VIEIERRIKTLAVSAVVALAVLSGIAVIAYANGVTNDTSATPSPMWYYRDLCCNSTYPSFGGRGFGGHGFRGGRGMLGGHITVSEEYKDNVLNITESDTDVQALLTEGYNITGVRPIISTTVEADGTVAMKATTAVVSLQKDTTGRAIVWVDVEQAKVTRIEILTITVIEK